MNKVIDSENARSWSGGRNRFGNITSRSKQVGLATMAIAMMTLFLTTLVVFSVGRAALYEQKVTANTVRLKEAYAAALEGSDYGAEWLKSNAPDWSGTNDANAVAGETASPTALTSTVMGSDGYDHTITYTLLTDVTADPALIRLDSTAQAIADTQVTQTVTTYILRAAVLGGGAIVDGPPLMVEDCVSSITGTPNIVPGSTTSGGVVTYGPAIGTLSINGGGAGCVDPGHFDLGGGTIESMIGPTSMVDALFGYDNAEALFLEWAAEFPETFLYVDSNFSTYTNDEGTYNFNGNNWHYDLGFDGSGNFTDPVIVWFDSSVNCPKINGNTKIYGLVYFEAANCTSNGWGGGEVYGTTAFTGDLDKFTANAELVDHDFSGSFGTGNSIYAKTTIIPGTWHDF